jgi:hypothetical protein
MAPILPKPAALGALLLLGSLAACDVPNFEGPQLQDPPQGFLLQPDSRASRSMFAHLPEVHHDAWVQSLPPYSTIRINGHPGVLTLEDVMAAQDSARAHKGDPEITFGAIEPLTVDGRDAWAWEERIETQRRGIPWVAYRVMVPYDTMSYTIEIDTEDPLFKAGAPESLRAIALTFAVGETVYNWPLMALGAGLLLFVIHMLRQRSQAKAAQLRSINLVKVEKKPKTDEGGGDGAAEPPMAAAGAAQGQSSAQ